MHPAILQAWATILISDPPMYVKGLVALQDRMDLAHAACHFVLQSFEPWHTVVGSQILPYG